MGKIKTERFGKTDGRTFRVERDDVQPGAVLRMVQSDGSSAPFSDCVVLDVFPVDKHGERLGPPGLLNDWPEGAVLRASLARPYARAFGAEAGPVALTGCEEFTVDVERMVSEDSLFRVLATARGRVCEHGT